MALNSLSIFPPIIPSPQKVPEEDDTQQKTANLSVENWNKEDIYKLYTAVTGQMKLIISKCQYTPNESVQKTRHTVKLHLPENKKETFTALLMPPRTPTTPHHVYDIAVFSDDTHMVGTSKKASALLEGYRVIKAGGSEYTFDVIDRKIKLEAQKNFIFLFHCSKTHTEEQIKNKAIEEHEKAKMISSTHTVRSYGIFFDTFCKSTITLQENCGQNLFHFLTQKKTFAKDTVQQITGQIVCGLQEMSAKNIGFLDCKLQNTTYTESQIVKFIDSDGWTTQSGQTLNLSDGFTPQTVDPLVILYQIKEIANGSSSNSPRVKYQMSKRDRDQAAKDPEITEAYKWLNEKIDFDKISITSLNIWAAGLLITQILSVSDDRKELFIDNKYHQLPWMESIFNINLKIREKRGKKVESKNPDFAKKSLQDYLKEFFEKIKVPFINTTSDSMLCLERALSIDIEKRPSLVELQKYFPCSQKNTKKSDLEESSCTKKAHIEKE
jgi:hypothetical protein